MNKKQLRAMKIAAQQAMVDTANAASRELTAEENSKFEALQREIDALTLEIEAEERQQQAASVQAGASTAEAGATTERQIQEERQAAIMAERKRVQSITDLCRDFNHDPSGHISSGDSIDQVRAAILEEQRKTGAPVSVQVTRDEGDTFRRRAADALLMRAGLTIDKPAEGAAQLRNLSLRDLLIECMSREGGDTRSLLMKSSEDLYAEASRQFFNPSAAFPSIMDDAINKAIVDIYTKVPTTFQNITSKGSLRDFKNTPDHEYVIGGVGDFVKVPENGEIKADKPSTELLPNRKLDTYGKQFSMTRQAFINDDIGFLTRVPGLYAQAAKKTIDKQVYKILFDNSKIFDGVALFHNNHKNLIGTGSAPSQAAIQAMMLLMMKQTDHFGDPIYITPSKIVVPVGYGFDLDVIFHSAQVPGSNNNDYNPLYNKSIEKVETPMLNALAGSNACPWFMLGEGAPGIQVDYLNGKEEPTIRRMEAPGTLGFVWDIYLDWGIAVRDYRSMVKNPGVALS